jgi:hypothetical protein
MERHTLHDTATNAAPQPTSHSYSAWRTSQQTTPRILQYNPPQQAAQQSQSQTQAAQQSQPSTVYPTQTPSTAAVPAPIPADLKSKLIFQNAPQFIQTPGTQGQFTALSDDSVNASAGGDSSISQSGNGAAAQSDASQMTPGGRALATSKRAAQNRAAQRAFRQRKERYIKSLEQKATDYDLSAGIITDLRKENIYLRDYVVRLQNEVDSLNSELGRAPMFGTRNSQTTQSQSPSMNVSLPQTYPIPIDPQTAAAAVAGTVSGQAETQPSLSRLAPAEPSHNSLSMPAATDQTIAEPQADETTAPPKKGPSRSRKRKNGNQSEAS